LRERAEEILGRERMRLQSWFQVLLTHAADANDNAGSFSRIFCNTSSFISSNHTVHVDVDVVVRCVLLLLLVWLLVLDDDDEDADALPIAANNFKEILKNK